MAAVDRSMTPDLVKEGLDKVFLPAATKKPGKRGYVNAENKEIFKHENVSAASLVDTIMKGSGLFTGTAEGAAYTESQFSQGPKLTITPYKFADRIGLTEEIIADDQWNVVVKMAKEKGLKARKTDDIFTSEIYRGAFTAVQTVHGKYVCDDTNATLNGDAMDNKLTDAFSTSALDTAVDTLEDQLEHDGTISDIAGDILLVAPKLWKSAKVIIDTPLITGSANNDINVYSSQYELKVRTMKEIGGKVSAAAATAGAPAITAGSDTAWFVLDENRHTMTRYNREGLSTWVTDPSTNSSHTTYYNAKFRMASAAVDFLGVVGSDGTA